MRKSVFVIVTLLCGFLAQLILNHYLTLANAAPQILLLAVVCHGFLFGPVIAQILGFFWGLMSDTTGVHLFGLNAFLLTFLGYLSGQFRRRVAGERVTAQVVMALAATAAYGWFASVIYGLFDEPGQRFSWAHFFVVIIYNVLFAPIVFLVVERWAYWWRIESERN